MDASAERASPPFVGIATEYRFPSESVTWDGMGCGGSMGSVVVVVATDERAALIVNDAVDLPVQPAVRSGAHRSGMTSPATTE